MYGMIDVDRRYDMKELVYVIIIVVAVYMAMSFGLAHCAGL